MGSIFVVFRRCIRRATPLAATRAKPLFLLAGAVLSRVRRLCNKAEKRQKSMAHRSTNASRTRRAGKAQIFCSWMRLGVDFGHLGATPDAPGRCPRTSSTDLGHLDLPRSTHFDRLGCLDQLRNTHFDPLGRILGQLSSFPAIGPGIELPCRAQLTIGPGRSGQVSSFPAALSLPTIRLTYRQACIARSAAISLHSTGHASSLVS